MEFSVPRTTLKDRISGRVVHGTSVRPKTYLTHEEEQELVDFFLKGMTNCHISQGWWSGFRRRWPNFSLRKGDFNFKAVSKEEREE